jgi:hypothetical protein
MLKKNAIARYQAKTVHIRKFRNPAKHCKFFKEDAKTQIICPSSAYLKYIVNEPAYYYY